jgi:hypothetical protein
MWIVKCRMPSSLSTPGRWLRWYAVRRLPRVLCASAPTLTSTHSMLVPEEARVRCGGSVPKVGAATGGRRSQPGPTFDVHSPCKQVSVDCGFRRLASGGSVHRHQCGYAVEAGSRKQSGCKRILPPDLDRRLGHSAGRRFHITHRRRVAIETVPRLRSRRIDSPAQRCPGPCYPGHHGDRSRKALGSRPGSRQTGTSDHRSHARRLDHVVHDQQSSVLAPWPACERDRRRQRRSQLNSRPRGAVQRS